MSSPPQEYDGPFAALTYEIIGSAIEVLNTLGHGLLEKPYENALVVELRSRRISCDQQRRFVVQYKGSPVGEYIPDLIVGNSVVVDAKVIDRIMDVDRGQVINYLRIVRLKVGLILNFRRSRLEWERLVA